MPETIMKIASACLVFASMTMLVLGRSDAELEEDPTSIYLLELSDGGISDQNTIANARLSADPQLASFGKQVERSNTFLEPALDQQHAANTSITLSNKADFALGKPDIATRVGLEDSLQPSSLRSPPVLHIGPIAEVTKISGVPTLDTLPVHEQQIRAAYYNAAGNSCSVLDENLSVSTPCVMTTGKTDRCGRVNAFTVGLLLDDRGQDKLPKMTINQVVKYFDEHRLSVQPMLLHDENGHIYFANETKAAFFRRRSQSITVRPEPMIETAVGRFRSLGIMTVESESSPPGFFAGNDTSNEQGRITVDPSGRTLAMAFTFQQDTKLLTGDSGTRYMHELLFLHLPTDFDVSNPRLEIFLTRKNRQELHHLHCNDRALGGEMANITAKVRFAGTTLMGMYPADPIVTDISFASTGSMQMTELTSKLKTGSVSMTNLLDDFVEQAGQSDAASFAGSSADSSNSNDLDQDAWLNQIRRRKEQEFEEIFGQAPALGITE